MMRIYTDFIMPPFARIQWASREIKEKYEPMFNKAKRFYFTMEKLTVKHGVRKATTEHIPHQMFRQQSGGWMRQGMIFSPIERVGAYNGFSFYHPPVEEGKDWTYYGALTRELEDGLAFVEATANGADGNHVIGELLGYPKCCVNDYVEHRKSNSRELDRMWRNASIADEKYITKKEDNLIEVKDLPWQANTMLRNFSVGAIFNIECKLGCEHTLENAMKWYELAKELNVEGLKEVEMFLRMPMEWDSHKGIAYIKTPLFKASINSNMCAERHQVRIHGSYFPDEAPRGLEFPWDMGTRFSTIAKNGNELEG